MPTPKQKQLTAAVVLLAICVGFYFLFESIKDDYCNCEGNIHIIDSHVKECKFAGLFDGPYVEKAAKYYDKEKYKGSFLFIDTLFPIAYSAFLLSLSYAFRRKAWYRWVVAAVVAGIVFDYGENFSFLNYLSAPSPGQANLVAFFTSMKSIIVLVNGGVGIFLLLKYLFRRQPSLTVVA